MRRYRKSSERGRNENVSTNSCPRFSRGDRLRSREQLISTMNDQQTTPAAPPVQSETIVSESPAPIVAAEVHKHGTAYDPAKHIHVVSKTTGAWMPRGGRKKKILTAPAASNIAGGT